MKARGYPDRRGMGAESDFLSEQFVPDERYKVQQMERARTLIAGGMDPEEVAKMFFIPVELLLENHPENK